MKRHVKRVLELLLVPFAAAVVFFEETLIRYLNVATAWLARWWPVVRLEAWLARLPAWAALVAFVAPSLVLLPVKLAAVWFAAHGRFGLAFTAVLVGKVIGTAMVARLYRVLHPTLMTLPWFASADTWFFAWKDRIYAFVRALPAWRQARELIQRLRAYLAGLVSGWLAR